MYTQLTSGGDVVILPAAEFDNATGNLSSVKIQRSMVGHAFSTIKRTRTVTLKLHYNLHRSMLKQLRNFLFKHPSDPITLRDWLGRVYVGYIYNETLDSTEEQQWSNSIDLLFEGRRLI